MDLQERLMADMQEAMRKGDTLRRDTIRVLRSAIRYAEIASQRQADDAQVVEVILHEVKQRSDAIVLYQQGKRDDLVTKARAEITILQSYLPRQLSEQEIGAALRGIIAELGASSVADLGAVMRQAMAALKGQVDGRVVNRIARELLSQ